MHLFGLHQHMKKNSVPLKEVLTLPACALPRAFDIGVVARAMRDAVDVQESHTPRCQQQRNADFSGLSCTHDAYAIETRSVLPSRAAAKIRESRTLSRKTWQQNYFRENRRGRSSGLANAAGLDESTKAIRRVPSPAETPCDGAAMPA